MEIKTLAPDLSVSPQLTAQDVGIAASQGFRAIIINRPDHEADDQPYHEDIMAAAARHGLGVRYLPVSPGHLSAQDVENFATAMRELPAPALAYCRTGTRAVSLWALTQAGHLSTDAIIKTAAAAGYDLSGLRARFEPADTQAHHGNGKSPHHEVLIIGGGAAGIATAASILKRRKGIDVAIVEPRTEHYYQPGWTLVGGGVFKREQTERQMAALMPKRATWLHTACAAFAPEHNEVILEDGTRVSYQVLIVAPGIKLDWDAIPGLGATLGRYGVTSNYRFDMAPYTWQLIQSLKRGKALFTQPPMPIKCAGAPQKAMYLARDAWRRGGVLDAIDVEFHSAGGVLFGVQDYVPALQQYVDRYGIELCLNETLVAVDGPAKTAYFDVIGTEGQVRREARPFDMLHVAPPQSAPDFVRQSPLADAAGWVDVDGETLQHRRYGNIFGLGDAGSSPNAKTAAAVRMQAPVVAHNVLNVLDGNAPNAVYNGYGSCPLTVERGKIVLAEFAYGGKPDPTLPSWLIDGTQPSRAAWFLKEKLLPGIYFHQMLRGNEFLARPRLLPHRPTAHEAPAACDFETEQRRG